MEIVDELSITKGKNQYSTSLEERFWSKVDKKGEDECWNWLGHIRDDGYGWAAYKGHILAHRLSWIINKGEIPEDKDVLHRCNNPTCVNPNHLYLGTQIENIKQRNDEGRTNRPIGERNPHAKLNWTDVDKIREKYATGKYTQQSLANEFGVSVGEISHIVKKRTWIKEAK